MAAVAAIWQPVSAEEYSLPEDVEAIAEANATEDITAELIKAVIWTESRGKSDAVSADGYCIGLMQLHRWYFSGDLTEPENNVQQGTAYLQSLYDSTGSIEAALMKYHGEANAVEKAAAGDLSEYARQIIEIKTKLEENKWKAYTTLTSELSQPYMPELTKKPARSSTTTSLRPWKWSESRKLTTWPFTGKTFWQILLQ